MKCKMCGGAGVIQGQAPGLVSCCPACHGTGQIEQTNDEWRRTCSTEEFAEFLFIIGEDNWLTDISNRDEIMPHENDVVEWLKQPHTFE